MPIIKSLIIPLLFSLLLSCSARPDITDLIAESRLAIENADYPKAQLKALEAESLMTDDSPIHLKESLARLNGIILYNQNIRDKARKHLQQAFNYASEMGDSTLMCINMFNLALCDTLPDNGIRHFELATTLAECIGNDHIQAVALEKLAFIYIQTKDFINARKYLDESIKVRGDNGANNLEIILTQCELWLAEGNIDSAFDGYESIPNDSLNIYGKLTKATALFDILYKKGDYRRALAYRDSIQEYNDSISRMDGTQRVNAIEESYQLKIKKEKERFQLLLWLSISYIVITLVVISVIIKNLRLKRAQIELMEKIKVLNVRISELMSSGDNPELHDMPSVEDPDSISSLIKQKFELSLKIFSGQSQAGLLKKLNFIKDFTASNKIELKAIYDALIGQFSSCCADLRQAFPNMTNDDCIYSTLVFVGCSKEIISAVMMSSDEALRRRKSRIKQKLPESIFHFFFSK